MSATRSTSRSVGPRPLETMQTRVAPPRSPAAACSRASSVLQPLVLEDVGGRAERLRAVVAVLGAQAGLEVDEVVDLDRVAEVLAAQACRGRDDVEQLVVGGAQDGEGVVLGRGLAVEDGVGELVESAGHAGSLRASLNGVQLERCSVCRVARLGCQRGSAGTACRGQGSAWHSAGSRSSRPPSTCCGATGSVTSRCVASPASSASRPGRSTGTWRTSRSCSSRWPTCCSPRSRRRRATARRPRRSSVWPSPSATRSCRCRMPPTSSGSRMPSSRVRARALRDLAAARPRCRGARVRARRGGSARGAPHPGICCRTAGSGPRGTVEPDLPAPDATTEAKAFEVGLAVIVRGLAASRLSARRQRQVLGGPGPAQHHPLKGGDRRRACLDLRRHPSETRPPFVIHEVFKVLLAGTVTPAHRHAQSAGRTRGSARRHTTPVSAGSL